jgi:hypothetical protein
MSEKTIKIARWLRYVARTVLVIASVFWFVFALFSGAEGFGEGMKGVLINSPNALPWLLLFVLVWVVWKWELIGGILISVFGLVTVFFFDTYEEVISFLIISLPLILLGGSLIVSWCLTKRVKRNL